MRCLSLQFFGRVTVVAVLLVGLSGCGGVPVTEVTGRVTYNGKPLDRPGGTISFLGADGIPHTTEIDTSGNYRAVGVCLGENKVSVFYPRAAPSSVKPSRAPDHSRGGDGPAAQPVSPFLIPEHYAAPETSKLTVVVDKNTVYNPPLEGPPIK